MNLYIFNDINNDSVIKSLLDFKQSHNRQSYFEAARGLIKFSRTRSVTSDTIKEYVIQEILHLENIPILDEIMAEIGDVRRFTHKGAITAFAGVDPGVNESGTYEQRSVPTSKRGSANLRKLLFQVMDVLIKTMSQDDPVYQFLDKKRAQGKPYYLQVHHYDRL